MFSSDTSANIDIEIINIISRGGIIIKTIKNYNDTKEELNIAKIRLNAIKEQYNSLYSEKKVLIKLIERLEILLIEMEKSFKKLKKTEYKIYYEIVINGLNVTKAIDKVSSELFKDPSTLWKKNYPKVKEELGKIKALINS